MSDQAQELWVTDIGLKSGGIVIRVKGKARNIAYQLNGSDGMLIEFDLYIEDLPAATIWLAAHEVSWIGRTHNHAPCLNDSGKKAGTKVAARLG